MNRAIGFSQPIIPYPCHFPQYSIDPKEKAQKIRQKWDPVSKRLVDCREIPTVVSRTLYLLDLQGQALNTNPSISNIILDSPLQIVQFQFTNFSPDDISYLSNLEISISFYSSGFDFTNSQVDMTNIEAGTYSVSGSISNLNISPQFMSPLGMTIDTVITITLPVPISKFDYISIVGQ